MNKTYTVEEISKILQVHYQTVFKLLRTKELEGFKAGRDWRITQEDLDKYIERKKGEINAKA